MSDSRSGSQSDGVKCAVCTVVEPSTVVTPIFEWYHQLLFNLSSGVAFSCGSMHASYYRGSTSAVSSFFSHSSISWNGHALWLYENLIRSWHRAFVGLLSIVLLRWVTTCDEVVQSTLFLYSRRWSVPLAWRISLQQDVCYWQSFYIRCIVCWHC